VEAIEGVSDRPDEQDDVPPKLSTKGLIGTIIMFVAHFAAPVLGVEVQLANDRCERGTPTKRWTPGISLAYQVS
jgi:hypothetical protein